MRVAFVVGGFPELSETFILDQMTGLLDRGHEIMIFARPPRNSRAPRHASVDEYGLTGRVTYWEGRVSDSRSALSRTGHLLVSHPLRTTADLGSCLTAVLRRQNPVRLWSRMTAVRTAPAPDVFLAQFGTNGVLAEQVRAACGLRVPLLTTFLGYDLSRILRQKRPDYYARLIRHGELMLPLSDYFRGKLIAIGCPPEKIVVQRLGVDTRRFAFRERTKIAGGVTRIASVCRMVEKKGMETGMHAFARLRRQAPQAVWHIIGDGPLRARLESLRTELELGESVVMHGALPREQVRQLLDEAHLFLAPSVTAADGDQEGTPVAIMEAMASGLPVVSTLHSGIPELVKNGVTGLLVPERDPEALGDALRRLTEAPASWAEMGRRGRAVVEQEYDVAVLSDRLVEILARAVSRHQ
ncbi:MAG TPA: glycosyltransferase [Gemmatimonadales bacterium]|nr:glycosyltransferase [Gemmatimonadales bacterium]